MSVLCRSEGMGESGGKTAACRGGRPAQAACAADPHRGGAAPQPPEHPGQQLHSRSAGEFVSHPSTKPRAVLSVTFI